MSALDLPLHVNELFTDESLDQLFFAQNVSFYHAAIWAKTVLQFCGLCD